METAPLTLAHTHARNAVLETRKSNPVAASEEHDLAAGEFATVAQTSTDREALRTLQLLEHHHKKLAQILRFQHEHPPTSSATVSATAAVVINNTGLPTELGITKALPTASDPQQQQPPKLAGNTRLLSRESSSIASNLASARGIPAQPRRSSPASPTLSSQQAGAKMTDNTGRIRTSESRLRGAQAHGVKERTNRVSTSKQPSSLPAPSPTDVISQQFVPTNPEGSVQRLTVTEEPFQRFYSTFEGFISKLSAPLVFAGFPLGADSTGQTGRATRKSPANTKVDRYPATPDRSSLSLSSEPDTGKIFSRAALRAIRDSTGVSGGAGGIGGAAESFYVVPTTGGTVSYAGILTRAEKEARRNSLEEGEEDFVDARETPSSPEMLQSFNSGKGKTSRTTDGKFQPSKTMEELQMENQALRHLSDTLSKRLHMWEVNAQSSSMALQQSLKAMHHQNIPFTDHGPVTQSSPAAPYSTIPGVSAVPPMEQDQRIKELEELVRRGDKELEQASRENDKLRNVLGRYRDRWEKLKEGAKTRRESAARNNNGQSPRPSENNSSPQGRSLDNEGADTEQDTTSNEPEG